MPTSAGGGAAGGMPPVGDVCNTAETIVGGSVTAPMSVMGTTVGFTNDYSTANQTGCVSIVGRDRVYSVSVAPNSRILSSVRPALGTVFNPSINVIVGPEAQCSAIPRVCVAADDLGPATATNSIRYLNTTATTEDVFVLVDTNAFADTGGTFQLDVSVDTPAQGDACESPLALMSGTPRTADVLTGFANDYFATSRALGLTCVSQMASDGPDRAYSVLVGVREALTVSVTPSAGLNTGINLHGDASDCANRTCITSSDNGAPGATDTLIWSNTATTARTVHIVVETPAGATGSYSITATTGPLPGDVCETTTAPITMAGTLTAQSLAGYSVDYAQASLSNGCRSSSGPDRVYAITVPARQRLVSTVVPFGGLDPVLNLISGTSAACNAMPRVCGASADSLSSTSASETIVWDNSAQSPQDVFLVVAAFNASRSMGTFSVQTSFTTGDHCRSPTVVSGTFPQTLTGQNFVGYRKDIDNLQSPCRSYSGPERVYEVTIPGARSGADGGVAPGRVEFSATSTTDLVLNVYTSEAACVASPPACLTGVDAVIGGTESVVITNSNAGPAPVFVTVSTWATGSAVNATFSATINAQ
jgi:hypothetical protein